MKILIVNTYDISGGAARAAYRLHQSVRAEGIDSQMLVQTKDSNSMYISGPSKAGKFFNKLRLYADYVPVLRYFHRGEMLFSPAWLPFSQIVKKINALQPDVVNLHWINNGMMRIEDVQDIQAPIVWTLHDMWPFTGGCHYSGQCNGYQKNCGNCPLLKSHKEHDLSRKIFVRKEKTFSHLTNLIVVGNSNWTADCARKSSLFKDNQVCAIPNPLNTEVYQPMDTHIARDLWKLPKDKKLVLFGAVNATRDSRKGYTQLIEALNKLKSSEVEFVVFGSSKPVAPDLFKFKTHYVGHVHDDISLTALYNAVDVMVVPSLQEAFGQTASESLACGTPVVIFGGASGLLDIVDHKVNGYVAKAFDTTDLAAGIDWVLQTDTYSELCGNAREKVLKYFDSQVVAKKYIDVYQHAISKK